MSLNLFICMFCLCTVITPNALVNLKILYALSTKSENKKLHQVDQEIIQSKTMSHPQCQKGKKHTGKRKRSQRHR